MISEAISEAVNAILERRPAAASPLIGGGGGKELREGELGASRSGSNGGQILWLALREEALLPELKLEPGD